LPDRREIYPGGWYTGAMRYLLLMFILIPIVEMVVLIKVGGIIGAIPTVGLVVLTATIGVWLLKREGLATINRVQEKMANGELPGKELLEGVMLIIGGALLLTPGFVTDAIGFVCLIPWLRQPVASWLLRNGNWQWTQGGGSGFSGSFSAGFGTQGPRPGGSPFNNPRDDLRGQGARVIDGEFIDGELMDDERLDTKALDDKALDEKKGQEPRADHKPPH
jgi:UPF0716 protein FxsA